MTESLDKLRVSPTSSGYVVCVYGRATLRESHAFCVFVNELLDRQAGEVVVDLTQCEHLDSTFLGGLLVLHKKHGDGETPQVRFRADADGAQRLFGPTGLDKIIEFTDEPCCPLEDGQGIPIPEFDMQSCGRHVLETHRSLANNAPIGAKQFASVADRIARDLEQQSGRP